MAFYDNLSDFTALEPTVRALWTRGLLIDSPLTTLFGIMDSTNAVERTQGLGHVTMPPKYTGGGLEFAHVDPLERKNFVHDTFAKALAIPITLIEDDAYGIVGNMLRDHAESFSRRVAHNMASVFNNAFMTTGGTAADGKALCATGRNTGGATLNNSGTDSLSYDSLIDTRNKMYGFEDKGGEPMAVRPDTLVVPTGLWRKAIEITASPQQPGSANNDVNVVQGSFRIIHEPLLTDDNNWFLVDSRLTTRHLLWFWRVRPEFKMHPASDFDLELRVRGRMRCSFGADDFSWIYGHKVA